jgi:hypothetical protein
MHKPIVTTGTSACRILPACLTLCVVLACSTSEPAGPEWERVWITVGGRITWADGTPIVATISALPIGGLVEKQSNAGGWYSIAWMDLCVPGWACSGLSIAPHVGSSCGHMECTGGPLLCQTDPQTFDCVLQCPHPASVEVMPKADTIAPGTSLRLNAVVRDAGATEITDQVRVSWLSSNESACRVTSSGGDSVMVTGMAAGTATIMATAGLVSGSATITVQAEP